LASIPLIPTFFGPYSSWSVDSLGSGDAERYVDQDSKIPHET